MRLSAVETKLTSGSPYWPIHNPKPTAYPKLKSDTDCEVLVIGGGITGALVSYHLSREGLDTILIDKHSFAKGSTSASTALISYEFDELLTSLSNRYGSSKASKAYRLCYEAVESLAGLVTMIEDPCDFDRKVSIRLSNTTADLKTFQAEERARNREHMPVRILTNDELRDEFEIDAQLGLVSENAAQIDPVKLARRLIERATSIGMRAYEHTKATSYEVNQSVAKLKTNEGAMIRAKHVVFATGYESEKYLGHKLANLRTDYCLVTHPLRTMSKLKKCHMVEHKDNYLYASTFGDRLMIGAESGMFHSPSERARRLPQFTRRTLSRVEDYIPNHQMTKDFHWSATFAQSKDSLPYLLRSSKFPRAWFMLGYGGNGIASCTMISRLVCDLLLGKANRNASLFSADR